MAQWKNGIKYLALALALFAFGAVASSVASAASIPAPVLADDGPCCQIADCPGGGDCECGEQHTQCCCFCNSEFPFSGTCTCGQPCAPEDEIALEDEAS